MSEFCKECHNAGVSVRQNQSAVRLEVRKLERCRTSGATAKVKANIVRLKEGLDTARYILNEHLKEAHP